MWLRTIAMMTAMTLVTIGAHAQETQPSCADKDKSLPAEMAGWTTKSDVASATKTGDLSKAQLAPGHAVTAALRHTPEISYAIQPEKLGGTVAYGGMVELTVKEAGTYRIGLGSGAWIDVVKDGKATRSTAHGHGPACSTIRKIVDFPLQPGRYVIQISANADPAIAVMAWRQP